MSRTDAILEAMGVTRDAFLGWSALVAGAARGIGEATARVLAGLGARVALVDVLDAGARVAAEIRHAGGEARFFPCDVADAVHLEAVIAEAEAAFGPVDILVNSAVYAHIAPLAEITVEAWDRVIAVNLRAPFVAMRRVLPGMVARRRGAVINLVTLDGVPHGGALNPSKAGGLRSLTWTLAREVGPEAGVAIFSVLPSVVDTPGVREVMVPALARLLRITEEEALARLAQNPGYPGLIPAEDCAATLAYLIAHGAEYHGQVADLIEPLARFGVIHPAADWAAPAAVGSPDFMRTFAEVTARNRDLEHRIELRTRELAEAHRRSEALLLNILPASVAARLKDGAGTIADHFDDVTVLFADLVGFTPLSAHLPPAEVVTLLDTAFSSFDEIARRLGLEKIKTIGDCYMAVGGLPEPMADHAAVAARAALEFQQALAAVGARAGLALQCRIGLHCGPVVAGVIGKHKFIYDLWGDTVNTASRMESEGLPGRIHCSEAIQARLHDRFHLESRGEIAVKGKGRMRTYFLVGEGG